MRQKLPQITVMNALLCLFVVMIHLTFTPLTELTPETFPHILLFAVNKSLCFCVPAFIFLSGHKLFESYKERQLEVVPFFRRRIKKIVVPYFFAVLIYIIYFGAKGWLEDGIAKSLFLGTVSAHFYYIVILIQLYVLFPLIFRLFERHSKSTLAISLLISVLCAIFLDFGLWDRFCGAYLFYFVFGMFWAKYELYEKICQKRLTIALIYPIFLIFHLTKLYLYSYSGVSYGVFPIINMLYVVCAIVLIYAVSTERLQKSRFFVVIAELIGRYSYSIYLYHCLGIFILKYDILPKYGLSPKYNFFITAIVIYALIAILCGYRYISKRRKTI